MRGLLIKWVILTASVALAGMATAALGLPFKLLVNDFNSGLQLFIGSAALALVNSTIGKILKFLSIPLRCLTLGLFTLVINGAMLYLVGSMRYGFAIENFAAAFVGSIFISIISSILNTIFKEDSEEKGD